MTASHGLNLTILLMILEVWFSPIYHPYFILKNISHIITFLILISLFSDVFFQIFDDQNILQDPGASNPVVIPCMPSIVCTLT